jgi:hypothetical protein
MTEPLTKLRGAPVDVDVRRAARVIVATLLAALAALVVTLFIADAHTNAEITSLQHHGVSVDVTVTGCNALLGGSGSNAAGYRCRGSYEVGGHHYVETLPNDSPYAIGAKVKVIAAQNDPGLIATVQQVRSERASWSAFVVPTVLLIVLIAALLAIILRRRKRGGQTTNNSST